LRLRLRLRLRLNEGSPMLHLLSPLMTVLSLLSDVQDPRAVLEQASAACKQVASVEFAITLESVEGEPRTLVSARVRMARADVPRVGFAAGVYAVSGTRAAADQREGSAFAFAYDGKTLSILRPEQREVLRCEHPSGRQVAVLLQELGMLIFPQFTDERPFTHLLDQDAALARVGERDVGGVACDVIEATQKLKMPDGTEVPSTSRWAIGREDHLPRMLESGAQRKTIRELATGEEVEASEFALPVPEGFSVRAATEDEMLGKQRMLRVGTKAPEWELMDSAKNPWSSRSLEGKVVLLDFAATWCAPCKAAMPILQRLDQKYRERGLRVLTVDVKEEGAMTLASHFREKGYTWPLLLEGDRVARSFGVETLPALFLIDGNGQIVHTHAAYDPNLESELSPLIERQLR
jgi:thiol-disulfide isomerase/thioredoxin